MSILGISFVWVGRATRRWQPKTKGFKAGNRLFCGVKVGLIQKNHGLMEKVVEGFGKS